MQPLDVGLDPQYESIGAFVGRFIGEHSCSSGARFDEPGEFREESGGGGDVVGYCGGCGAEGAKFGEGWVGVDVGLRVGSGQVIVGGGGEGGGGR
eukprot:scaffold1772_cov185-Alexandrium_tamarense.AAC.12